MPEKAVCCVEHRLIHFQIQPIHRCNWRALRSITELKDRRNALEANSVEASEFEILVSESNEDFASAHRITSRGEDWAKALLPGSNGNMECRILRVNNSR